MVKLMKMLGGKTIRSDNWDELGVSTFTKLKEAVEAGRKQEALDLLNFIWFEETGASHHSMPTWVYFLLTYIADNFGEEKVYETLREYGRPVSARLAEARVKMPVEDYVRFLAQVQRSHRAGAGELGNISITEYPDRYVLLFDPCGSGGAMRRTRELDKTPVTKKAYPWSWSKAGVPYYCTHCCVFSEIMAVESIGYPVRVTLFNEDPQKPCAWAVYKKPELIPEEYFTRIGKVKDPSRFKRG